jgi:hypothetical protein
VTSRILHTGVKGMRWGVRKLKEEGGEIVRKKGEELHTVTGKENLDFKNLGGRALYTSFTEKDVLAYRGMFSDQLRAMNNIDKVFDYTLVAATDLVSPNKKRRIDELINLHKEDTGIVREMGKTKIKATGYLNIAKYFGYDKSNKYTQEYRRLLNSKDPKDQEKAFRDFSKFLPISNSGRKKYFDRLSKKGFNSIYDDNDIYAGYSKRPLIIFNPAKTIKIKSKTHLTDKLIDEAFEEWEKL